MGIGHPQLDKIYFEKYPKFFKKSVNKKYNDLLRKYKFDLYIEQIIKDYKDLPSEKIEKYVSNIADIKDIVLRLFYTHIKLSNMMSYDLTTDEGKNKYIDKYIKAFAKAARDKEKKENFAYFENATSSRDYTSYIKQKFKKSVDLPVAAEFFMTCGDVFNTIYGGMVAFMEGTCSSIKLSDLRTLIDLHSFDSAYFHNDSIYTHQRKNIEEYYHFLFDIEDEKYIEIPNEDKFVEKQLVDIFFGCELIGYIVNTLEETADDQIFFDVISETGVLSIVGINDCTKRIIDDRIKKERDCVKKEDVKYSVSNVYEEENNTPEILFVKYILDILYETVKNYVGYLFDLKTHNRRVEYIKNIFGNYKNNYNVSAEKWWQFFFDSISRYQKFFLKLKKDIDYEIQYLDYLYLSYFMGFSEISIEELFLFQVKKPSIFIN